MTKRNSLLSLVLALCLCFMLAVPALAAEDNTELDGLYVLSKECPEDYIDYARETIGYLLWDHNVQDPYLGTPFTFGNQDSDTYYFPVYSKNKIVLTFRVYLGQDGDFNGIVSPAFAEDLNNIAKMTSPSNPLKIIYENRDDHAAVVFELDNYDKEVQSTPIINYDNDIAVTSLNDDFVVIQCRPVEQIQQMPVARASRSLNLSIVETQKGNSWCMAYCTAIVMRYNGIDKRAKGIMQEIYGEDVATSTTMGTIPFRLYMEDYGFQTLASDVKPSYGTVYTAIEYEINNNRPLVFDMKAYSSDSFEHAIVARGYDNVKGSVSVWNPWYGYFETVTSLNNYVPAEHSATLYVYKYYYNNYR